MLETIIHQISHAIHITDYNSSISHGEQFQRIARKLGTRAKLIQEKFSIPYKTIQISSRCILSGDYDKAEESI